MSQPPRQDVRLGALVHHLRVAQVPAVRPSVRTGAFRHPSGAVVDDQVASGRCREGARAAHRSEHQRGEDQAPLLLSWSPSPSRARFLRLTQITWARSPRRGSAARPRFQRWWLCPLRSLACPRGVRGSRPPGVWGRVPMSGPCAAGSDPPPVLPGASRLARGPGPRAPRRSNSTDVTPVYHPGNTTLSKGMAKVVTPASHAGHSPT